MNRVDMAELVIASTLMYEIRAMAVEGKGPEYIAEVVEKMHPTISAVSYALVQFCADKDKDDFTKALIDISTPVDQPNDDYEDIPF